MSKDVVIIDCQNIHVIETDDKIFVLNVLSDNYEVELNLIKHDRTHQTTPGNLSTMD